MADKDFGQGIFDMEFINEVNDEKDFGKQKAMSIAKAKGSKATEENKTKAINMVNFAKNSKALLMAMTNFSLSHQGLKTLK